MLGDPTPSNTPIAIPLPESSSGCGKVAKLGFVARAIWVFETWAGLKYGMSVGLALAGLWVADTLGKVVAE